MLRGLWVLGAVEPGPDVSGPSTAHLCAGPTVTLADRVSWYGWEHADQAVDYWSRRDAKLLIPLIIVITCTLSEIPTPDSGAHGRLLFGIFGIPFSLDHSHVLLIDRANLDQ
jgi:hypothetical protein